MDSTAKNSQKLDPDQSISRILQTLHFVFRNVTRAGPNLAPEFRGTIDSTMKNYQKLFQIDRFHDFPKTLDFGFRNVTQLIKISLHNFGGPWIRQSRIVKNCPDRLIFQFH